MKSLSSVGLGLSIVFGSLLLALVAELYYLLWWKKRLTSKRDLFYMFCLKTSSSSSSSSSMAHSALNPQEIRITIDEPQQQQSHQFSHMQSKLKPFDDELMRPPRVLFTIVEETKEDLEECEEAKSRPKFGSMLLGVETPYFTPIASPPFLTPPHTTPLNPLFESASDAEFNKTRASPPPKLKFLKEAEEKLHKRMLMEERVDDEEDEDESFITINVDRSKERGFINQHQFHSSYASQVLPLISSPSTFSPPPI
ncbi:hypothetical protein V6N13_067384 [Hibiscus sabdariffa]|uniref:Membrane lipoprotein n=1 Tax=Hibiscus sabdariffa TaxID=183260 RepID=A0ABR2DTU1_9ROSI